MWEGSPRRRLGEMRMIEVSDSGTSENGVTMEGYGRVYMSLMLSSQRSSKERVTIE